MIHVVLSGGLGNWLFQYAAGRRLAHERGTGLRLDLAYKAPPWRRSPAARILTQLRSFAHVATLDTRASLAVALECHFGVGARWIPGRFVRERSWGWDPAVFSIEDGDWLLGYFQSERYFQPIAEMLRAELSFAETPPDDDATRAVEARISTRESVAVHVRRGDYLRSPQHNVCTGSYYDRALRHIRDRTQDAWFFIFSDDPDWCRRHLRLEQGEVVDLPASRAMPSNDLRLMSRCRHHVVANSTFSWWGAWLGAWSGQVVVAPARWFNNEDMNARALKHTLLPAWTRVEP